MSAVLDRPPEALGPGSPLPLAWHWLYFKPATRRSALGPDGHERRGDFLPPVPLPRRMWAGGRLRFLGTLRLGEAVQRRSTIATVRSKEGRSGPLVFVTVRHEIANEAGVAIEEDQDLVYRDGSGAGGGPPKPPPEAAEWSESFMADAVTLFRFSALTFNSHRIHYDHRYVTEVEGYPDLVVHGPLIALLLLDAGSRRLEGSTGGSLAGSTGGSPDSFSYRAVSPLFCGEEFTIAGRANPEGQTEVWAAHPERGLAMRATLGSPP
ncbi:MAG: MaoC family dehydratase N-terminal domain-containing protein [Gemmatimonadetes bacterium]|nr:MaoC family dehydratase N-terminal domain-containing protein [Gemmatimonadota bacterium]